MFECFDNNVQCLFCMYFNVVLLVIQKIMEPLRLKEISIEKKNTISDRFLMIVNFTLVLVPKVLQWFATLCSGTCLLTHRTSFGQLVFSV
ncbi:hypothetical protein GDO86_016481 [Hymenochirus boettgeri]|uniref:Uncharacterized protein n=1 Tax=Hymenochirus boettgeri TaxID=247094 RepID=A0A8T2K5K0_9PIPI|nr:hypothetical protein GDO86_016481 [Hymenochirus boettgeri]